MTTETSALVRQLRDALTVSPPQGYSDGYKIGRAIAAADEWLAQRGPLTAEHDALRGVTTELLACLIEARDDVAAELQRCREAAGYPSTDRRLAAQEALIARVDSAIKRAHGIGQPAGDE